MAKKQVDQLLGQICEVISNGFDIKPILEKNISGATLSNEEKKKLEEYHKKIISLSRSKRWRVYE
jgi:hypothetical protein